MPDGRRRIADVPTLLVLVTAAVTLVAGARFPPDLVRGQSAPSEAVAAAPPARVQDFDFVFNYARWAASRPGISPYTYDAHRAFYAAWLGPRVDSALCFPYGPITMLLLAPLFWLAAPAALLCWNVAGAWAIAWVVGGFPERRRGRTWGRLGAIAPSTIHNLLLGQTALVTTALAAAAVRCARAPGGTVAIALCLVVLTIKPPLAVVVAVGLLLAGIARPVAAAALGAGLVLAGAVVWWTPAVVADYAGIVSRYNLVDADPIVRAGCVPQLMTNLRGVLLRSGLLDDSQAFFVSGGLLGALLLGALAHVGLTRRTWPLDVAVSWAVVVHLVFAPHLSPTEDVLLLVPLGLLLASDRLGFRSRALLIAGCVGPQWANGAMLALAAPVRGTAWTSIVPIVPFALKVAVGILVTRLAVDGVLRDDSEQREVAE